jgi:hypothetical protein
MRLPCRLLEMREQMQAGAGHSGVQAGLVSGGGAMPTAAPIAPPGCLPFQPQPLLVQHAGAQPRPAGSAVSAAAGPPLADTPPPVGASAAQHVAQRPQHAGPQLQPSVQSSPSKQPPAEQQQQAQQAPARMMPPLWGSVPEGLAMLAAAAACSEKGGSRGGKEGEGCSPHETDSDTDTTGCERHTV